jgi:hypothetical protein
LSLASDVSPPPSLAWREGILAEQASFTAAIREATLRALGKGR